MNGSIRVGNLFGIPFFVHGSWFLVLLLVTASYGTNLAASFPQLGLLAWLLGLVTALGVFASVLAHELGHSWVALRQGIDVKSITLFLFGGLANLERESETPAEAFSVAIAGPAVSIALFGLFFAIAQLTPVSGPLAAVVSLLASVNLILALFNLIPGVPLDGGNVLKAAVWKVTGNPYKGVVFASRVGQAIGWIGIVSGLVPLFAYGSFNGIWNVLIGWFLLQNAGRSAQAASLQQKLSDLTVKEAVTPDSPIVPESLSLRQFANEFVIGQTQWRRFLVVNESGQLVGTIAAEDMKTIATSEWPQVSVQELTKSLDEYPTIAADRTLLEAVNILEERQLNEIPAIDENGMLVGLLQKNQVIRLLQKDAQALSTAS